MNYDPTNRPTAKPTDLFEEYEFRPMTQGLGFHRKTLDLGEEISPAKAKQLWQESYPLSERMPLEPSVRQGPPQKPQSGKDIIATIRPALPEMDFDLSTNRLVSEEPPYLAQSSLLLAGAFDAISSLAIALVFLVAGLSLVEINLLAAILNPDTQGAIQLSLVAIYAVAFSVYMIGARLACRRTLGEWAFDAYLGERFADTRDVSEFYSVKVLLRTMIVLATGGILMPLLSFVVGKDLSGALTGTQLFQQEV